MSNYKECFKCFINKFNKTTTKLIDNVNIKNLSYVLKSVNITIPDEILDIIIDAVELLEEKGDMVTIKDIINLENKLKNYVLWKTCLISIRK